MEWISVKEIDKLPEIGEKVLGYYTITGSEYYEVCRIESITETRDSDGVCKRIEWMEGNSYDIVEPELWTKITPPKK